MSAISAYKAALDKMQAASVHMQSLANAVSVGARTIGYWKIASLRGTSLVVPATRILTKEDEVFDLATWPSSEQIINAINDCLAAKQAAQELYSALGEDERSLISGPGSF